MADRVEEAVTEEQAKDEVKVAPGEEGGPREDRRKWIILATLAFGTFMATLDSSIVNIALPTIRQQLQAGDAVEWVVLSYLLATTSTLLLIGRLSDLIGRRPIYVNGFAVFTFGSLLCGLAWDIWSLVGFRVLQGLGAAMLFAIGPAIVSDTFGPHERGRALGWIGTVVALGTSLGPVLGGLLLSAFGWPAIFFVNVPIGLVAIWRAYVVIPEGQRQVQHGFDIPGAALFVVGIISVLIGLNFAPEPSYGWGSPLVLSLLGIGGVLLAAFLLWELRAKEPLLRLSMFRIWPYAAALLAACLVFTSNAANLFVIPFFLQQVLQYPAGQAGFILLAGPIALSVASPIGGNLSDRFGPRWVASGGLLLTTAGYFLLTGLEPGWSWHDVVWRTALISFGLGLFQSPNSSSALNAAPKTQRGVASSLLSFMRNLGFVVGVAVGAAVWYSSRTSYALTNHVPISNLTAQVAGMRTVYITIAAITLLAALISLARGRIQEEEGTRPRGNTAETALTH
ncbi:MAG: MFS transporter [Candidatus Chloroheliales bacterium]|nr:MAG: MFS transporter [Chloroflexota bacterium]